MTIKEIIDLLNEVNYFKQYFKVNDSYRAVATFYEVEFEKCDELFELFKKLTSFLYDVKVTNKEV